MRENNHENNDENNELRRLGGLGVVLFPASYRSEM
jgi:hypothetical protein